MTKEELVDEILAVDAIFPECAVEQAPQIYNFSVPMHSDVEVQLSFPEEYPDEPPELLQVIPHDAVKYSDVGYLERTIQSKLKELFLVGCVVVIELLTELEAFFDTYNDRVTALEDKVKKLSVKEPVEDSVSIDDSIVHIKETSKAKGPDPLAGWIQSEAIVDRGSTFIAFAREVNSLEEAEAFLDILITDKKVAKASHNISAWRIKGEKGAQYQDCDDDGETAAGSRVLHLLTMMDIWNVIVVVSRWFGGTHIGPDRFKHINSAARDAIVKGGFEKTETKKSKKKK